MTTADYQGIPARERRIGAAPLAGAAGAMLLFAGLWTTLVPSAPRPVAPLVFVAAGTASWLGAFAMLSHVGRRRAVLAAAGVATGLLAVEVTLRVAAGSWFAPLYRVNGAWLFEYRPGVQRTNVILSGKDPEFIAFAVNSQGFRGPELRTPGAARRVVVYGDSFIAAAATKFEETYCEKLREALRESTGSDVEVVNAGIVGTGPDQSCLRMEAELATLEPDLVVVSVLAENDYGDIVRNRLFELGSAGELVRSRPEMPPEMRDTFAPPASVLVKSLESAVTHLQLSSLDPLPPAELRAGYLAACRDECNRALSGDTRVMHPFWDHPDTDVRLEPASASARYKTALMERVLSRIRDVAIEHSVPLVFLVIPAATDVCADYDGDHVDAGLHPGYRATNRTRPIETVAAALGVPHVSLFDTFRTTDANHLYCHGGDTHWNSAGQALAAEVTARRITALRLLR